MTQYRFAGVDLTPDTIQATRQWFHDNALAVIEEGRERFAHDPDKAASIAAFWSDAATSALTIGEEGGERVSVAFLQRAHTIQTGECIALLP